MNIDSLTFVLGQGKPQDHTACIMSAARILAGEATEEDDRDDNCSRVCDIVRRFAIGVNDWRGWKDATERTEYLRPLTLMLLDTAGSRDMRQKRAFISADFACRFVVPLVLDLRGKTELAKEVRGLPEITNRETALLVHDRVQSIAYAYAAYAYAYAAYAYAAADAAAYAADASAASAAAYAAADAAYAADASDASARVQIRDGLIDTLKRMCAVTQ